MADEQLQPVIAALQAGDRQTAARLLKPLLKEPTADRWYLAALLSGRRGPAERYLKRALRLDPDHARAQQRLAQLRMQRDDASMPSIDDLTSFHAEIIPANKPYNPAAAQAIQARMQHMLLNEPLKRVPTRRRQPRSSWFYIRLASSILFSFSAIYFVLLVFGSGIPGRLRGFLSGSPPQDDPNATVVYATPVVVIDGTPYYGISDFGAPADATPITQIDGTPVYARPDAVIVVEPVKSVVLPLQETLSDVLEPGFAHEYVFSAAQGDEMAVGIQFFSPTAQRVGRNVVVLDPNGNEAACDRDQILEGDNGVFFSCQIYLGGEWKLRLFGREGESSGAYFVALERFET